MSSTPLPTRRTQPPSTGPSLSPACPPSLRPSAFRPRNSLLSIPRTAASSSYYSPTSANSFPSVYGGTPNGGLGTVTASFGRPNPFEILSAPAFEEFVDDITSSIKRALAGPPPVERRAIISPEREAPDEEETMDVFGEIKGVGAEVQSGEVGQDEDEGVEDEDEIEDEEDEESDSVVADEEAESEEDVIATQNSATFRPSLSPARYDVIPHSVTLDLSEIEVDQAHLSEEEAYSDVEEEEEEQGSEAEGSSDVESQEPNMYAEALLAFNSPSLPPNEMTLEDEYSEEEAEGSDYSEEEHVPSSPPTNTALQHYPKPLESIELKDSDEDEAADEPIAAFGREDEEEEEEEEVDEASDEEIVEVEPSESTWIPPPLPAPSQDIKLSYIEAEEDEAFADGDESLDFGLVVEDYEEDDEERQVEGEDEEDEKDEEDEIEIFEETSPESRFALPVDRQPLATLNRDMAADAFEVGLDEMNGDEDADGEEELEEPAGDDISIMEEATAQQFFLPEILSTPLSPQLSPDVDRTSELMEEDLEEEVGFNISSDSVEPPFVQEEIFIEEEEEEEYFGQGQSSDPEIGREQEEEEEEEEEDDKEEDKESILSRRDKESTPLESDEEGSDDIVLFESGSRAVQGDEIVLGGDEDEVDAQVEGVVEAEEKAEEEEEDVLTGRIPYHLKGKGKASVSGSNESTAGTTDDEDDEAEYETSSSDSVAGSSDSLSSVDPEQLYDSTEQEIKQIHNNIVRHIRKANKLGRRDKYNFFVRQLETVRYVINNKGDEEEQEVSGEEEAVSEEGEQEGEGEEEEEGEEDILPKDMPMSVDELWNEYENLQDPDRESVNENDAIMEDEDGDQIEGVDEQHFEDDEESQQSDTENTLLTAEEAEVQREMEKQISKVAARLTDEYFEGRRSFVYVDSRAMSALPTPDGSDGSEDGMESEGEAIVTTPAPAISKYFLIPPPSSSGQRSPPSSYYAPPPPASHSDTVFLAEFEEMDENVAPNPPSSSHLAEIPPAFSNPTSDTAFDEEQVAASSPPPAPPISEQSSPTLPASITLDSSEIQPIDSIDLVDSDESDQDLPLPLEDHEIEGSNWKDDSDEVVPTEVVSAADTEVAFETMVDVRESERLTTPEPSSSLPRVHDVIAAGEWDPLTPIRFGQDTSFREDTRSGNIGHDTPLETDNTDRLQDVAPATIGGMILSPTFKADLSAGVLDQSIADIPLQSVTLDSIGAFVLNDGSSTPLHPLAASELEIMIASAMRPPVAEIDTSSTFPAPSDSQDLLNTSSLPLIEQVEEVSFSEPVHPNILAESLEDVSEPFEEEEELLVAHADFLQQNIQESPQYLPHDDVTISENEIVSEEFEVFPSPAYQASEDQQSAEGDDISEALYISNGDSSSATQYDQAIQSQVVAESCSDEPILEFEQVSESSSPPLTPATIAEIDAISIESQSSDFTAGDGILTSDVLEVDCQQALKVDNETAAPSPLPSSSPPLPSTIPVYVEPVQSPSLNSEVDQAFEESRIFIEDEDAREVMMETAQPTLAALRSEALLLTTQSDHSDDYEPPLDIEELHPASPSQVEELGAEPSSLVSLPVGTLDRASVESPDLSLDADMVNDQLENDTVPSAVETEVPLRPRDDILAATSIVPDSNSLRYSPPADTSAYVLESQLADSDTLAASSNLGTNLVPSNSDSESDSSSDEGEAPSAVIETLLGYRLKAARAAAETQGDSDSSEDELALKVSTPSRKRPLKSSVKSKLANSDRRQSPRISREDLTSKAHSPPLSRKRSSRKKSPAANPIPAEDIADQVAEPETSPRRRSKRARTSEPVDTASASASTKSQIPKVSAPEKPAPSKSLSPALPQASRHSTRIHQHGASSARTGALPTLDDTASPRRPASSRPSVSHLPVTRSHCEFTRLSIQSKMAPRSAPYVFIIPSCAITSPLAVETIEEFKVQNLGPPGEMEELEAVRLGGGGLEERAARDDLVDGNEDLIPATDVRSALRRIVGPELWHEGTCEILPRAGGGDTQADVESSSEEEGKRRFTRSGGTSSPKKRKATESPGEGKGKKKKEM